MENNICNNFEQKVLSQIKLLAGNMEKLRLGAAVSGGADSVSLLTALSHLCKSCNIPLYVISVNHFIRPDVETCGDALFVEKLCTEINRKYSDGSDGFKIIFSLTELEKGSVVKTADERGGGVEEAARFLRYKAFEAFKIKNNLDYVCLAHNKNDQLETLLMRFLQGSGTESSAGIGAKRDFYIRPLLNITRTEIEEYLTAQGLSWRTDSTNSDTNYLRNRIRHNLIPLLNEDFPGWQTGVLNGAKKAEIDGELISSESDKVFALHEDCKIGLTEFSGLPEAVKARLLVRFCNKKGCNLRIPFAFINDVLTQIKAEKKISMHFDNVEISTDNKSLFVKNYVKTQTDLVFFAIIEEEGLYDFSFGQLLVSRGKNGEVCFSCGESSVAVKIKMPFCIRNVQYADEIKCKNGSYKKVTEVYSDWHVAEEKRSFIPLVQELETEKQEIRCIFGEPFGFYNWVVNEKVNN